MRLSQETFERVKQLSQEAYESVQQLSQEAYEKVQQLSQEAYNSAQNVLETPMGNTLAACFTRLAIEIACSQVVNASILKQVLGVPQESGPSSVMTNLFRGQAASVAIAAMMSVSARGTINQDLFAGFVLGVRSRYPPFSCMVGVIARPRLFRNRLTVVWSQNCSPLSKLLQFSHIVHVGHLFTNLQNMFTFQE